METGPQTRDGDTEQGALPQGVAMLVLALVADVLFYGQRVGLSLGIYAVAIAMALYVVTGHRNRASVVILMLTTLPVIEDANPLSVVILTLGLIVFTLRAHHGPGMAWADVPGGVVAFVVQFLPRAAIDTPKALYDVRQHLPKRPAYLRRNWAMPLGLGLCFGILLTLSNPILQTLAEGLLTIDLAPGAAGRHAAFCIAMAAAVVPFLATPRPRRAGAQVTVNFGRLGINATSVRNALILFNVLFAVQTTLDLTYLWAGATLPAGMTPATYAHRGAYPLLVTALLAGVFALISRPFAHGRLRILLLAWLAQNVVLVVSALYRLDLYVQAFGLTYLRLSAGIWMALVAAGLGLTAWQILRQRSNAWLLVRCALLGLGTLYICAFINFAHIIASVNLQRPVRDHAYLCSLGPNAAAAIRAFELTRHRVCVTPAHRIMGWRDWGFRTARVQGYVSDHPLPGTDLMKPRT
jgi:Domain of unknown function (DUF4173)